MEKGEVLAGQYQMVRVLGRGGMAEVWEAYEVKAARPVAIKFLRSDLVAQGWTDDTDRHQQLTVTRQRFHREGALMEGLVHRGIPQLYDRGFHGSDPYIVMQLIDGVSLHEFINRHTVTVSAAAAVVAQIADALTCVHALPIVHRDLKPHNVLIGRDGTAVLIDFGVAKPINADATGYTQQGSTVGSRGYQAPEQLLEEQVTPATDLYALGCILYLMLTGRAPFIGEELARQHVHDLPTPIVTPNVPLALGELTLQLLAKKPADRPVDAATVRQLMERYVPMLGDPDPTPRFDPDPTVVFRVPRQPLVPSKKVEQGSRVESAEPDGRWLRRQDVRTRITEAQAVIDAGNVDGEPVHLAEIFRLACGQWGNSDSLVVRLQLLLADWHRHLGDCGAAATLYEGLIVAVGSGGASSNPASTLLASLGLAECRIPYGDLESSAEALSHAIETLPSLDGSDARSVIDRSREVAIELDELGHHVGRAALQKLDELTTGASAGV